MNRSLILILLLLHSFVLAVHSQKDLNYSVSFLEESNELEIEIQYRVADSMYSSWSFPDFWGGATDLSQYIDIWLIHGMEIVDSSDLRNVRMQHQPKALVRMLYRVSLAEIDLQNLLHSTLYRPHYSNGLLQFIGSTVFIYPNQAGQDHIRFDWDVPSDWEIHNSFGTGAKKQMALVDLQTWSHAVFWLGHFQRELIEVHDKPVYVAFNDENWNFSKSEFNEMLFKVVSFQRQFWDDFDFPYYTVTLSEYPATHQGTSHMGTGLENSFALYATRNSELDGLMYLLMHELLHEWIGHQIPNGEPEEEYYWFSEGFTDYFTYLLAFESGLASREDCIDRMNQKVSAYYNSPLSEMSNFEINSKFFANPQTYGKIPYDRGSAFAMYLDQAIRQKSNAKLKLKDLMIRILHRCREEKVKMSRKLFVDELEHFLPLNADSLVGLHMYDGDLVPIQSFPGVSQKMQQEHIKVFDAGFDYEASLENRIVEGVVESSNAYKAGLRNGQRIKGVSMYMGDTSHPVELQVEDKGNMISLNYIPVKLSENTIPVLY